jgi:hypothetical protein
MGWVGREPVAGQYDSAKSLRMIRGQKNGCHRSGRVPDNDGLLDFQGIENVCRLLCPEGVPILKGIVPLAQAEAIAIESHDPV